MAGEERDSGDRGRGWRGLVSYGRMALITQVALECSVPLVPAALCVFRCFSLDRDYRKLEAWSTLPGRRPVAPTDLIRRVSMAPSIS
jgi:hypothetical protein